VTAVCDVPVGVDLESVSSVDRAWADLPVTWAAASPRERAGLWCGIEAVAKLTGEGLTLRRGEAHLDGGDPSYQTLLGAYDLHRLPAPPGYAAVAAVAARDLLPDLELKGRAGVEGRG
jgi:phosphopantetheinyl transferase